MILIDLHTYRLHNIVITSLICYNAYIYAVPFILSAPVVLQSMKILDLYLHEYVTQGKKFTTTYETQQGPV